jgi:hypothetical protein
MHTEFISKKNYWIHVTEGAFYLSSGVLLSPQTVFPALVARLGGDNVAVGAIPIIVYLTFFLPQILSASFIRTQPFRKPWAIRFGILQRLQVLLFAVVILLFGVRSPSIALISFFAIYVANQVLAGLGSPVWFDLVAKTTIPAERGKLMGIRTSVGALLGFMNGFLLTALLTFLVFPFNYSSVFAVAFALQFSSWMILRNVTETQPSVVEPRASFGDLVSHVRQIILKDRLFRRFLVSVAFLIVGLMPAGFYTIAAMKKFALDESYVGLFTVTMVSAQIVSGVLLGWLADKRGHKASLLVCACATAGSAALALMGVSVVYFFGVFFFVGVNLGAEMITRYNFVERCAPERERPLYVGIMNAWLAPFYFSATVGGWLSDNFGYECVFLIGLIATVLGAVLLARLPDPSRMSGVRAA